MEYNYTAITLKKRKIGETDRLYTFYTLESGKIQAIGRGIRKPKAKLSGHVETLNQADIIVARRHGLGNIASAISEQYFPNIKADAFALGQVFSAIACFERLVDLEEKDEELFFLLREYLSIVDGLTKEGKHEKIRLLTQGFLFQVLNHLGYRIDVRACSISGRTLSSEHRYYFSPDIGGIICSEYISHTKRAVAIDHHVITLMRVTFTNKLSSLSKLAVSDSTLAQSDKVLNMFLEWISA